MSITVAALNLYPVKGLSAQPLERVPLAVGEGLPQDRRFAITHGASTFDPAAPEWRPKTNYLALVRDEKLATLQAEYDPDTAMLVLNRAGKPVSRGRIDTPTGRMLIEQFLAAYMKEATVPGPFKIVEAPGLAFTDIPDKAVSLLNLASVRDIERITRAPIDPLRFRANLHLDGLEPWAEMDWVGRRLRLIGADAGDGADSVELEVFKTTTRCAATEVNPATAERDINMVKALKSGFGHAICGVYARVVRPGTVSVGDGVVVGAAPADAGVPG
ncbi:MAG: hypothetical protein RLY86_4108 [Pseudomonadota bacterium]|jgi:uncharacterized protein YcbX